MPLATATSVVHPLAGRTPADRRLAVVAVRIPELVADNRAAHSCIEWATAQTQPTTEAAATSSQFAQSRDSMRCRMWCCSGTRGTSTAPEMYYSKGQEEGHP